VRMIAVRVFPSARARSANRWCSDRGKLIGIERRYSRPGVSARGGGSAVRLGRVRLVLVDTLRCGGVGAGS
jgi:hypothetical protein